jgi:hypothetical protein
VRPLFLACREIVVPHYIFVCPSFCAWERGEGGGGWKGEREKERERNGERERESFSFS